MRRCFSVLAKRRAAAIAARLAPHLPRHGPILDIGSGTGHNAEALRDATALQVVQTDVVDMHVVGEPPVPFDGRRLPFAGERFTAALLCYVLQYPDDPVRLLREAARVSRRVILVQSPYRGPIGWVYLRSREWLTGRCAFRIARLVRFVAAVRCPLRPNELLRPATLRALFDRAGLQIRHRESRASRLRPVSRDLFVLERR